jgi:TonB-dependent receptor
MNKNSTFKYSLIALSVSSLLGTLAAPVLAQEASDSTEVIEVRGLRSSLAESAAIKRNSVGIVDAISAEDIGKFPDTNLAESLQRITGVSISRVNGEGSEVTVRGFGGENNMITLNGRMMPAASAFGQNQGGAGRAFDFANLASEGIRAVEVYKTSKADIATGGIGATINLITTKPLQNPGTIASVGVKAVSDTTNRTGSDITPELSGIFSWTDDDAKIGVSLTASHQQRDSGTIGASVNDWRVNRWDGEFSNISIANGPNGEDDLAWKNSRITNAPAVGQLFSTPNNMSYDWTDTQRTRNNAQLTFQFAPNDDLTFTADYTFAQNNIIESAGSKGNWMTRNYDTVAFDNTTPVATAILISEDTGGTKDNAYAQNYSEQTNTLKSLGLNLEYYVRENLKLNVDYHDSNMLSDPDEPTTGASSINVNLAAPIGLRQNFDFGHELPKVEDEAINDTIKGNGNGLYDIGDLGSQYLRFFYNRQETDIQQAKVDLSYEFDEGRFDFGIETRSMEMTQRESYRQPALGDWGVNFPMDVPLDLVQDFDVVGEFSDFDISGINRAGFEGSAIALGQYFANLYDIEYAYNRDFGNDHLVAEDTTALYFQVALEGELGGMRANFLAGVRYEDTDTKSRSNLLIPTFLEWNDNNDFFLIRPTETSPNVGESSYDHLLPSLDFDLEVTENLKTRFSFSQTIARAGYSSLRAQVGSIGTSAPTLTGGTATAAAGNPSLVPLQSNNFDVSAEYYYDDTNYVSVGFFEKRVKNFIGTEQVKEPQFGLRDPTAGPRALAAVEALEARGFQVEETSLFVMTAILDNPQDFPNGADDYVPGITFGESIAANYNIRGNSDDPLFEFATNKPVNNKEASIYGFELAGQHFFGDTGFGVAANYTIVRGDIGFDNTADPSVTQFALLGLSDSANLVAMYEKDGITARLAYNWRDEYLASATRGGSNNPEYVESFSQLDLNVSYDVNDNITVFVEGINITGEDRRTHARSYNQLWSLSDLGARYQIGARYTF